MKRYLLPIAVFVLIIALAVFLANLIESSIQNYNFISLNRVNKNAKSWKIPKGYKLLYSKENNNYKVQVDSDLKFCIWTNGILLKCDVNDAVAEDGDTFKDTVTAKYYAKLYFDHEHPVIINTYKPL